MNGKQFAFIICTNDMQYYSWCVRYIQDLYIPEGYDTNDEIDNLYTSQAFWYNANIGNWYFSPDNNKCTKFLRNSQRNTRDPYNTVSADS